MRESFRVRLVGNLKLSSAPKSLLILNNIKKTRNELHCSYIQLIWSITLIKNSELNWFNSNPNFTTITHLSEVIWCKVKHENVMDIRYPNTTITDVMYSTGIEHKIRVPYLKVSGKTDEQSEVHKTDTDAIWICK